MKRDRTHWDTPQAAPEFLIFSMTVQVSLTHAGLSRIADDDFVLRTDRELIRCSRSQIKFLSPRVSRMLILDPTISYFKLGTSNSSTCSDILREIIKGNPVEVTEDKLMTFCSIASELDNDELIDKIKISGCLTIDNVIESICVKLSLSVKHDEEIAFISKHFYEFDSSRLESLKSLDITTLESILSHELLSVEDEHSLFEFIIGVISYRGNEFASLLSHIHLEYLDTDGVSLYLSYVDEDNIGSLFPAIARRLVYPLAPLSRDGSCHKNIDEELAFQGSNFEGILSYLYHKSGGNPVLNGTISIEETTNFDHKRVSYLVDPAKREDQKVPSCGTRNDPNGSFMIDFKNRKVTLSSYSLKALSSQWSSSFPNSWKVEGSNDKSNWTLLDSRRSGLLHTHLAEAHFNISNPCSTPFRFFRIMMTSPNSGGNFIFALHAIEFFGFISKL